jgi:hypothetical protein
MGLAGSGCRAFNVLMFIQKGRAGRNAGAFKRAEQGPRTAVESGHCLGLDPVRPLTPAPDAGSCGSARAAPAPRRSHLGLVFGEFPSRLPAPRAFRIPIALGQTRPPSSARSCPIGHETPSLRSIPQEQGHSRKNTIVGRPFVSSRAPNERRVRRQVSPAKCLPRGTTRTEQ